MSLCCMRRGAKTRSVDLGTNASQAKPTVVTKQSIGIDTSDGVTMGDDIILARGTDDISIPYHETELSIDDTGFRTRSIGSAPELPLGVRLHGALKLREDGLTGKGIRVGVIDDGVAKNHPGFNGMVKQSLMYHGEVGSRFMTHGTHVAGTIHMMAPEAEIYDYNAMGGYGKERIAAVGEAIEEAILDGCDIINMSIGGTKNHAAIQTAVRNAFRNRVIMVAAAGNIGDNDPLTIERNFPACNPQCISIGAVSKEEGLPVYRRSVSNTQVDYAGIGVRVDSFRKSGGYTVKTGTSMASPHCCGLIAALMTKGGKYAGNIRNDSTCRQFLNENCLIDVAEAGRDNTTGLGFLTYLSKDEFDDAFDEL